MTSAPLTPEQQAQLERFADLVGTSPHNLVSRRARQELRSRHVPEAVALAGMLPSGRGRILDVGSGGGFPGLVIAIARPELDVHLLEATRKKVEFLREAASELGVPVSVHHGRAEDLAKVPELAGRFEVVTARAVAALAELVPLTVPFLSQGGILYAVKGQRWREELEAASSALRAARASVLATPDDDGQRVDNVDGQRPLVVMIGRSQ
jgi:16S rRNA (guanine527-N7)-methyltransferase